MYKGDLASIPATDRRISNSEIVLGRYKTYSGHTIPPPLPKVPKRSGGDRKLPFRLLAHQPS